MNISGLAQNSRAIPPAPVITPQNYVAVAQAHLAKGDRVNAEKSYNAAIQLATAELAQNPGHARETALADINAEYAVFLARENASDVSSIQQSSVPTNHSASAAHQPNFSSDSLPFPIQASTEGKIVVQNCQGTINAPVQGTNNTVTVYYSPNSEVRQPHAVSLDSLRTALYQHYQLSNLSIQRVSGETASLEDCYINLAIVESQAQREKDKKALEKQAVIFERLPSSERLGATNPNKLIALDQLFEKQKLRNGLEGVPKRILIRGRAGIGKTTLCKKLVYEYHQNGPWQDQFDCVLWVPLRQLKTHAPKRLEDLLCTQYFAGYENNQAQALSKVFYTHKDKTLFILDGLDEVVGELNEGKPLKNFLQALLNQMHVVITSRPASVDTRQLGKLDLELETIGFSSDDVRAYIKKFAPVNRTAIEQFIDCTPLIQELVNIPIQLDALCYSWDSLTSPMCQTKTITMSALYQAMVEKLWHKDGQHLGKKTRDGAVLQLSEIQALSLTQIEKQLFVAENDYLSYLAFQGLRDVRIEFDLAYLKNITDSLNEARESVKELPLRLKNDFKKTSFLHTADAHLPEGKRAYHFLHLTFQEFFAAKFLVRHLNAYAENIGITGLVLNQHQLQTFIAKHKYNPRYEITWWMVAGLLKGKALEDFFSLLQAAPRDLIGIRHQQMIMRCLNEARAELNVGTVEKLEAELIQWVYFEIKKTENKIWGRDYSRLGSQSTFPERLLLESLSPTRANQGEVIITLGARSNLSARALSVLIGALKGQNWMFAREVAARALGKQKTLPVSAISALNEALINGNESVQAEAIRTLNRPNILSSAFSIPDLQSLPLMDRSISLCTELLKNENWDLRYWAVSMLGLMNKLPDPTILALTAALKDENEQIRIEVTKALGNQNTLSASAISALTAALKDKNEQIRIEVIKALGNQNTLSASAISALTAALKDENEQIRIEVIKALGNQNTLSASTILALTAALKDENEQIKIEVTKALGKQKTQSALEVSALIEALKDESGEVRAGVARALDSQHMLSAPAISTLTAALKYENDFVRTAVAKTLGKQNTLPDTAVLALIKALENNNWRVQNEAKNALGKQKTLSATAISALLAALKDENKEVGTAAASILGEQNTLPDIAVSALITAVENVNWRNESVRKAAVNALGKQKTLSNTAIAALLMALKVDNAWIRAEVIETLGKQSALPDTAFSALITALKDENWSVRTKAARALGTRKTLSAAASSALLTALNDRHELVRSAVIEALYLYIGELFTLLPDLALKQIQALYEHILLLYSCDQFAFLYIQDNQLHFYTATGPGQPIEITSEQTARIVNALRAVRAEAGIPSLPEEERYQQSSCRIM